MNKIIDKEIMEKKIRESPIVGFDDYPFKKIFKENKDILKKLVELVTNMEFENEFQITDSELKSGLKLKTQRCDLLLITESFKINYIVDLEAQEYNMEDNKLFDRALLSAIQSYLYLSKEGKYYSDNKRTIVIYFMNDKYDTGVYYKDKNKGKFKTVLYEVESEEIHNNITLYFINVLPMIKNLDKSNENDKMLVEYLKVLSAKDVKEYLDSDILEVRKMAERINKINEGERLAALQEQISELLYDFDMGSARAEGLAEGRAEGEAKGRAEGLAEGEAKGRVENQRKNILSLYKKNKTKEEISDLLDIDINVIEYAINNI